MSIKSLKGFFIAFALMYLGSYFAFEHTGEWWALVTFLLCMFSSFVVGVSAAFDV